MIHDLVAQILKISAAYTPPPPEGFVSPMTWGVEDEVTERFTAAGVPNDNIAFAWDTFIFNYPGPPSGFLGVAVRQPEHEREPWPSPAFRRTSCV